VSVIALSDLGGLSLRGVQWPLDKRHVLFGSTLTLSNIVLGPFEASLQTGHGLIIAYPAGE
jgi:thiamine pyrophosphokinase